MGKVTTKDVFHQLKADLIGKDSYRGVTLSYSWLANQFGHFSLAFIPTIPLYFLLKDYCGLSMPGLFASAIITGIWVVFETYNFLGPLLSNRVSHSKLLFVSGPKYQFQPAWLNIAFDTFTDLCFFSLGAFSSGRMMGYYNHGNITILSIFTVFICLVVAYPAHYWYLTKIYQQNADYPFQFRLSQFDLPISEENKTTVKSYLQNNQPGKHLLIFGERDKGKTSLSVGLANEKSIQNKSCVYLTAMKLSSMFFEPEDIADTIKYLWTWRNTDYLVIDDIDPGDPIKENIISSDQFLEYIDKYTGHDEANRKIIQNTSVIWVLGNDANGIMRQKWTEMLQQLGVSIENISCVEL
ncbi:MAG: hypothetical protein K2Q21_07350 [Chitinophagaceae bacterium]|nr:hypothetical protein [Chitinophagaceae bacterium]